MLALSELSPEFRVLLGCLSDNSTGDSLEFLIGKYEFSWMKVYRLSVVHKVTPLVWKALQKYQISEIPLIIQEKFRQNIKSNTLKSLKNAAELVKLTRLFEKNDIRTLPLKGSVLAIQVYGGLSERYAGDIDLLLVDPQQLWQVDSLVQSLGYVISKPSFELNSRQKQAYLQYEKDIVYWHPESKIVLELHFSCLENHNLLPISSQMLWDNREPILIANEMVYCLSRDNHFQYLLAHGAKHGWYRLMWLCDIPRILAGYTDEQKKQLWDLSLLLGIERLAAQGMHLSHLFLDMPIVTPTKNYITHEPMVASLSEYAINCLINPNKHLMKDLMLWGKFKQIIRGLHYKLRLRNNWTYRLTEVRLHLIRPTVDWDVIHFPKKLFIFYILLSPFLWIIRQFKIAK